MKITFLPLFLYIYFGTQLSGYRDIYLSRLIGWLRISCGKGAILGSNSGCCNCRGNGGLAVPDFQGSFLAGPLVFVHRWFGLPGDDTATTLEAAIVGSYEALAHLLLHGNRAPYNVTVSMQATGRTWVVANKVSGNAAISPHAPL